MRRDTKITQKQIRHEKMTKMTKHQEFTRKKSPCETSDPFPGQEAPTDRSHPKSPQIRLPECPVVALGTRISDPFCDSLNPRVATIKLPTHVFSR